MIRPLYLLTAAVFLGLLLPWIVRDGMFLDGVTYAAISRNLAHGLGTFWAPHYTDILYPQFFEHPPLAFGIQSLFFRVCGDSMATERIYTLFTALVSLYLLAQVWILFADTPQRKTLWWLPVLLWIATPVVFWSYRNNMLENTLTIFVLAATWFTGKAILSKRILWLMPAGLFILAAFLTKGPVGLFPLVIPACYRVALKGFKTGQAAFHSLILILVPVVLFLIIVVLIPEAEESIRHYWQQQVVSSVGNHREISDDGRFGILLTLISELTTPFFILLLISLMGQKREAGRNPGPRQTGVFLLLIGAAASLPLMITLKQHNYYLVPSIPYFVMGLCYLIPEFENRDLPDFRKQAPWLRWVGAAALVLVAAFTTASLNQKNSDPDLLADVQLITSEVPAGAHISVPDELCSDWRLIAYLSRKANISLDPRTPQRFYLAARKSEVPDSITEGHKPVQGELSLYQLFKIKAKIEN
ncbi:MAG TPA: hypothetical protein DC042_12535 [Bacteroidales bacterium]|nr:hypothetical protein [Bacteroidales bacterium]